MRQPVPFGKYLLLDRISVGGMAEVFKAKSYGVEGFEKIIAIKRILPTMGEDRDFIKMFIDEAKIAGQLAHANICQIFELGRIDGSHFIAMEFIWGKDLLQIQNRARKNKQQMPIPMACFVIAKVLEGLDYAHRKRDPLGRPLEIVHRDCSPQNVLVSYEGEVKVIDFGIAKATSRNSRTMAGVLKGKFGYMSPEQVRGLPLDRRSDIFALGTMLFECLTGERLFQGETDFSTLEKVRNVDVASPRSINPAIPDQVERIILKALAKDVDDRYQWCSEMLADLQQFLMAQDVVFTAKTLSSWLKEGFSPEIDRERSQLEQYKRVGRDGLIAGMPAAQAKLDVNEHLGEAGAPEGDATTLGGPNFEDVDVAVGASPDLPAQPKGKGKKKQSQGDDDEDFDQEVPTEIFGEDGAETNMPGMAASPPARPLSSNMAATKPPKAPPGRPSGQRAAEPMQQSVATRPTAMAPVATPEPYAAAAASPPAGMQQPSLPAVRGFIPTPGAGLGMPGAPDAPHPPPAHSPAALAQTAPANALMDAQMQGGAQKTVLGMQAPLLGSYPPPNFRPSMQQPMAPPPAAGYGGYPSAQNFQPQMYQPPMQTPMQGAHTFNSPPVGAAEPSELAEGRKSTLVRDIGIGVAIAALVLVGILMVKMFVLDKGKDSGESSTIATVRISMPGDVVADMFVDGKKNLAAVRDADNVPVTAGMRQIKLVGPGGASCEAKIQLEAGKVTTLQCAMSAAAPAPAPAGSAAGSGSAATAAIAPAGSAAAPVPAPPPAAGSGAAQVAVKAPDVKPDPVKVVPPPPTDPKTVAKVDPKPEPKADPKLDAKPKTEVKADPKPKTEPKPEPKTEPKPKTEVKAETKPKAEPEVKAPDTKTGSKPDSSAAGDSSGKGYLQVFSKPSAKILVDGVDTGMSTPISGHALSLAPGKHKITFVIGDDRFTYSATVKAGSTETLSKDLQ